jgi:predicted regulator of Ras-like GTPase activity (Roadblock/LC7/MglB family)
MTEKKQKNDVETMQEKLQGIKDQEGIIGYILRDQKSASIDLKDPTKVIDYAVLSSTSFDVAKNIAESLQIGDVGEIIVESEETKLVSMNTGDNRLSIFMERSVDHNKLFKSLK